MTQLPDLTDPREADAFVEALRVHGDIPPRSLLLTLIDSGARPIVNVAIDDVPVDPPQHERVRLLAPLLRQFSEHGLCQGVLLAIGRRGSAEPGGSDLGWHDAFVGACKVAGLTCHGVFVVTQLETVRIEPSRPDTAA